MKLFLVNVNYVIEDVTEESFAIPCATKDIAHRELKNQLNEHVCYGRHFSIFLKNDGTLDMEYITESEYNTITDDNVSLYDESTSSFLTIEITETELIEE